ncbi:hypothetical protein BMS3Bbin02_01962 [bacterium BMS3Bbin02]|nr:hypothetical protein BMS3Bbin02_01962 [bacterium BMS3Bbin02]
MIPVLLVAVSWVVPVDGRRQAALWVVAALWLVHPVLAGIAVLAIGWVLMFQRARKHRVVSTPPDDVVAFGELVSLALSSGASPLAAVALAGRHGPPSVGPDVHHILRKAAAVGAAVAFRGYTGAVAPVLAPVGHALATGAPLGLRVDAALGDLRAEVHAERMARVRRLPVRLLFPLTLLILPGFMVLTLGPSLLAALDRLQF